MVVLEIDSPDFCIDYSHKQKYIMYPHLMGFPTIYPLTAGSISFHLLENTAAQHLHL